MDAKTIGAKSLLRLVDCSRPEDRMPVVLQRAFGAARLSFKLVGGRTALDDLYQQGCLKVRLPQTGNAVPEAILINTAGGMTDGDCLSLQIDWQAGTSATLTTQAAERIYRSRHAPARIDTRLVVADGARAFWLPQETILFDGGRLDRRNHVSLSGSASLVACEAVILGRAAMGEAVHTGDLRDNWMIEHEGRRLFIDKLRLKGDLSAQLARRARGDGANAFATIIVAGSDAAERRDALRPLLAGLPVTAACSDLDGVLVARLLAPTGHELRSGLMAVLELLCSGALPRVWTF